MIYINIYIFICEHVKLTHFDSDYDVILHYITYINCIHFMTLRYIVQVCVRVLQTPVWVIIDVIVAYFSLVIAGSCGFC